MRSSYIFLLVKMRLHTEKQLPGGGVVVVFFTDYNTTPTRLFCFVLRCWLGCGNFQKKVLTIDYCVSTHVHGVHQLSIQASCNNQSLYVQHTALSVICSRFHSAVVYKTEKDKMQHILDVRPSLCFILNKQLEVV